MMSIAVSKASASREVHEEYAVQRWPETKRLLGLLVNSSGAAHARNARRLVHATRKEDRRLSAALLAAALAHTPEAADAINSARTRMARKPAALARELLRNFPKGRRSKSRRRSRKSGEGAPATAGAVATIEGTEVDKDQLEVDDELEVAGGRTSSGADGHEVDVDDDVDDDDVDDDDDDDEPDDVDDAVEDDDDDDGDPHGGELDRDAA
jgi:hypothetical protein